jgi:hypothetical protein
MKRILILALILQGCAMSGKTYLPDGRQGYTINCSGIQTCESKAGDLCGARGYTVIDRQDMPQAALAGAPQIGIAGGTNYVRTMLIACNG